MLGYTRNPCSLCVNRRKLPETGEKGTRMNEFKVDYLKVDADGHITSYMADVNTDEAYTGDTEVIKDGYFAESEFRSAPYFDLQIDGINLLNTKM